MHLTRYVAAGIAVALLVAFGAGSCGNAEDPSDGFVEWAKVSPSQLAEAKRLGIPVAFENDLEMRFALIPAGAYRRKRALEPWDADGEESFEELVIREPFYMQITEVTNAQYRRFRPDHDSGSHESFSLNGDQQPAVKVSWLGAEGFAKWLSTRGDSRAYRLPTDVEWEYACRAGTSTRYPWGDVEEEALRFANVRDARTCEEMGLPEGAVAGDDGHRVTAPVGSYVPNAWGLHDMIGNVWEWCSDTPPAGPAPVPRGNRRIARGGAWTTVGEEIESSSRLDVPPGIGTAKVLGFRLVVPLPSGSRSD